MEKFFSYVIEKNNCKVPAKKKSNHVEIYSHYIFNGIPQILQLPLEPTARICLNLVTGALGQFTLSECVCGPPHHRYTLHWDKFRAIFLLHGGAAVPEPWPCARLMATWELSKR